jgi:hypothetical protein
VSITNRRESIDHLAIIGEIHLDKAEPALADPVHADHLVTGGLKFAHDNRAEFSG